MLFILILIICSVLFSFFSLLSFAILRSNARVVEEDPHATAFSLNNAQKVLASSERYLLFTNTCNYLIVCIVGAIISCTVFTEQFGSGYQAFIIAVLLFLFSTILSMTLTQLAKAYALNSPERFLFLFSLPLVLFLKVFSPIISLVRKLSSVLLKKLNLRPVFERDVTITAEDFGLLAERSTRAGKLEEDEGDLIQGIVKFSDTLVQEVMTPRMDIISVHIDASIESAIAVFVENGLSRLLVVGDELDEVHGILIAKDLINLIGEDSSDKLIKDYIRNVFSCSTTMQIDDLLEEFQKNATHFAVVIDEHGGVSGVITVEDVIEEIVGDIFDEYDSPEDEQEVTKISSKEYIFDGGTLVDDINADYNFNIPVGEYDTIAGFILSELEEIPEPNAKISLDDITIEVLKVESNRIVEVRIVR